ncbi:MAG: hypothetical protein HY303_06345 [Candidatus Wallbacteria bacterium]|nr:hypothetical protein [Candidatus Wallbacteria bacterium]
MKIRTPLALALALAVSAPAAALRADPPAPSPTEEAIRKDQDAALRYIGLRLQKQQSLLKRGRDEEAVKLEAECLRQEAKCLERYLWYMRRDTKLKTKAKAISTALDDLKKKEPKASLEERRKAGFKPADLVANPLGVTAPPEEKPKSEVRSFDSAASDVTVNKPTSAVPAKHDPRFDGVKPPPGADAPPDAGSAGSAGSGNGH